MDGGGRPGLARPAAAVSADAASAVRPGPARLRRPGV